MPLRRVWLEEEELLERYTVRALLPPHFSPLSEEQTMLHALSAMTDAPRVEPQ
jgi:hypothetical protein